MSNPSNPRFESDHPLPGIRANTTEDRLGPGAYAKRPLTIIRGQGVMLFDSQGNEYLDMTSGHGVALLGHSHPALAEALANQANRLITCPEIFYNDQRAALYQALERLLPPGLNRYFLCNSGAEAVEGAIKLARALSGRPGIVAARQGFHGRTMGALSATWNPKYRTPFVPLVPGFRHIPFNDSEAAAQAIDENTAALIVEIIQGEGGVNLAQTDFLVTLRRLCSERGALLIVDEIQTGFGRTGQWFACQHHDLIPDILCLGKGIAGGIPMGVVAWRRELGKFSSGTHGSTFGGNPLACAAALATLSVLEEEQLPERAARLGRHFLEQLGQIRHPLLRQVRGKGLMIGLEMRTRVTPILKALMTRGILALPAGSTVLRLLPPLVVESHHIERVTAMIAESLDEVAGT